MLFSTLFEILFAPIDSSQSYIKQEKDMQHRFELKSWCYVCRHTGYSAFFIAPQTPKGAACDSAVLVTLHSFLICSGTTLFITPQIDYNLF